MIAAATVMTEPTNRLLIRHPAIALFLIGFRNGVLGGSSEHASPVGKRHSAAGGIVRAVLRPEPFDTHRAPNLQDLLGDSSSLEHTRRAGREPPIGHLSSLILHIEVKPDV